MAKIGRPKIYEDDRVTKAVRVSPDLDLRLKAAAKQQGISANLLITTAIEEHLDSAALRVPTELEQRLSDAASERQVGIQLLLQAAVEDYLERLPPLSDLLRTG